MQAGIHSEVSPNERVGHGRAAARGCDWFRERSSGGGSVEAGLIQVFKCFVEYSETVEIQEVIKTLPLMKVRKGNIRKHLFSIRCQQMEDCM